MQLRIPIASLVIVLGCLEFAGGAQEFVYRGVLRSETGPLTVGMLGALAGALLLASGVSLLARSGRAIDLIQATAGVSVPVFVLAGIIRHYAGWPITAVGILTPLLLALYCWKSGKAEPSLSRA